MVDRMKVVHLILNLPSQRIQSEYLHIKNTLVLNRELSL